MFALLSICIFVLFDGSAVKCGREARFILESKLSKEDRPAVPMPPHANGSRPHYSPSGSTITLVILPDAEERAPPRVSISSSSSSVFPLSLLYFFWRTRGVA